MAVLSVSGEPGCRAEEVARLAALELGFQIITESALRQMLVDEYGSETAVPDRLCPDALSAILARLAREHHLLLSNPGSELLIAHFPSTLRVAITASERFRVGALMIDHNLDRPAAVALLRQVTSQYRAVRRRHYGRSNSSLHDFDLILNSDCLETAQAAHLIAQAVSLRALKDHGTLSVPQEAALQFRSRLRLARRGIVPAGKVSLDRKPFVNESEQIFANLLDFYRIAWEYEPRSFAIQWDNNGRILESFTPDFYLPEFDLYVELTTMKQANVTRKNRKVKLLKTIYPHVNIQVFYQKDFQNLVFKYGLAERPVTV